MAPVRLIQMDWTVHRVELDVSGNHIGDVACVVDVIGQFDSEEPTGITRCAPPPPPPPEGGTPLTVPVHVLR